MFIASLRISETIIKTEELNFLLDFHDIRGCLKFEPNYLKPCNYLIMLSSIQAKLKSTTDYLRSSMHKISL